MVMHDDKRTAILTALGAYQLTERDFRDPVARASDMMQRLRWLAQNDPTAPEVGFSREDLVDYILEESLRR